MVRIALLLAALVAAACVPAEDSVLSRPNHPDFGPLDDPTPGANDWQPPEPDVEDTAPPPEPEPGNVEDEDIGGLDDPSTAIFNDSKVHTVELTLSEAAIASLYEDYQTYVEADVVVDGYAVDTVGVRLKGMIGSLRDLSGKPSLKIDFNWFVEDQRFFGIEKLTLNNEVVDCSNMKERLAYAVFAMAGVPERRTAFAWVTINGAIYGLYTLIETPDDVWLDRVYEDPSGNLYDGNYYWYGGWSYILLDFTESQQEYYALDEGTDVGLADIRAVTEALWANYDGPEFYEEVGAVVDLEGFANEFVAEMWVGQDDGYALNTNNYLLYFDPSDGRMDMLPWDLDYSFLQDWEWGMDWAKPKGVLAQGCKKDERCRALMADAMQDLIDTIEASDMRETFDDWAELSLDYAMSDPRRECSTAYIESERDDLRYWGHNRSDEIRADWGLE